ncbi:50S ribosomal protein L4 [Patescibacteria group bacterium]|nr:50S ribosomal protein L4 [Patescibacteria group bacterium]MBU1705855.1 50S ribosomal protein L4 [Patescibacteria group bacterium]
MANVKVYNLEGQAVGDLSLVDSLFGVEVNRALVHEAVVAQEANSRVAIAHTKDRSDVVGSGKKPWKQKGTGRARHGTKKSPIWKGGGVTFGPRNIRNFFKKLNKPARRKALAMVLSDKVANDRLVVVEDLILTEAKTKILTQTLTKLPVNGKKTLIVLEADNIPVARAARNIPNVETISSKSLNVVDLINYDYLLAGKQSIATITETYQR